MSKKIQKRYDKETLLDTTGKQEEWDEWVKKELIDTDKYNKKIILRCK